MTVLFENRKARHEYHIEADFLAGMQLEGWEVKALQSHQATFNAGSAFIRIKDGEAWLEGFTIQPLAHTIKGMLVKPDPLRSRKLLLNRAELDKLDKGVRLKGYTVVPLAVIQQRKLKLKIALAKGKNVADKRNTVKDREVSREIDRAVKTQKAAYA